MRRFLIVNADDCNLTEGVTSAILDCHDHGILSSTTFMMNLPISQKAVRELKQRKNLGVGIHLNVTLGRPVTDPKKIRSLLQGPGDFRKYAEQTSKLPKASELVLEYQSQINLFKKVFGRNPTHLDTHHQLHDAAFFFHALVEVAKKNRLPIRRSRLTRARSSFPHTDFFFGNLRPREHWTPEPLETLLQHLPEGVSEIMCHPGKNDPQLRAASSFTTDREVEWKIFRDKKWRRLLQEHQIKLGNYAAAFNQR